jgi:hypothetical protein
MAFYRFLADSIVVVHFAYVAFVVGGAAVILAGAALGWRWVRNFWFRAIHFLMIAVVVAESLGGVLCPLTDWEDRLRELAGEPNEPGSFIGRWIHSVLFVDASRPVLTVCYSVFALAVLLLLFVVPPHWPGKRRIGLWRQGSDSASDDGAAARVEPLPRSPGP